MVKRLSQNYAQPLQQKTCLADGELVYVRPREPHWDWCGGGTVYCMLCMQCLKTKLTGIQYMSSILHIFTSFAARGGGGSFKRLKLYNSEEHLPIESFVTTLMHWTFFSDDANKVGICWLCRSGQLHVTPSSRWSLPRCHRSVRNDMRLFPRTKQYAVQLRTTKFWKVLPQYYSVLQSTTPESTTPVLLPVLQSTTSYYKVLVQYYSVLQSTSPVLLRTTKYYSSTSPVLQSTTSVLLRTTKDYSSTTKYYKGLLQYYFVLQSTTPVVLRTTNALQSTSPVLLQYYFVLQSTTPVLVQYYRVLLRTTKDYSSTTKY